MTTPNEAVSVAPKGAESNSALLKNKEIKKLIDLGLQRGYLTYEEVNELLPPEILQPEQIDSVIFLLADNEIEVLDTTKRPKEVEDEDEEGDEGAIGSPEATEDGQCFAPYP
jgi:RNA polymerase primary sigma factor